MPIISQQYTAVDATLSTVDDDSEIKTHEKRALWYTGLMYLFVLALLAISIARGCALGANTVATEPLVDLHVSLADADRNIKRIKEELVFFEVSSQTVYVSNTDKEYAQHIFQSAELCRPNAMQRVKSLHAITQRNGQDIAQLVSLSAAEAAKYVGCKLMPQPDGGPSVEEVDEYFQSMEARANQVGLIEFCSFKVDPRFSRFVKVDSAGARCVPALEPGIFSVFRPAAHDLLLRRKDELIRAGAEMVETKKKLLSNFESQKKDLETKISRARNELRDLDGFFVANLLVYLLTTVACLFGLNIAYQIARAHMYEGTLIRRRRRALRHIVTLASEGIKVPDSVLSDALTDGLNPFMPKGVAERLATAQAEMPDLSGLKAVVAPTSKS